jgi:hypothetical protein
MRRRRVIWTYICKILPEIIERRPENTTIELLSTAMFSTILPHDFYTRTLIYGGQKCLESHAWRTKTACMLSYVIWEFTVSKHTVGCKFPVAWGNLNHRVQKYVLCDLNSHKS